MTFVMGQTSWNKGKKYSAKHKGRPLSKEHKEALKVPRKGAGIYGRTETHKEITRKGIKMAYDNGTKMGFRLKKFIRKGSEINTWKGGITPINEKIRKSVEYKLWRQAIFEKDNFTCIWCGKRGGDLEVDHIKPFALFPELRFAIDNGRTLCKECHGKTFKNWMDYV